MVACVLALLCFANLGCREYPKMSDGHGVHLIAALRTACSSENDDRLTRAAEAIDDSHQSGQLSDDQHAALRAIIEKAQSGSWDEAERMCADFQKAQVR